LLALAKCWQFQVTRNSHLWYDARAQVQGVADGVRGHETVPDVGGDDLGDGRGDLEDGQVDDQGEGGLAARVVALA